ncbi:MAG: EAL domain-containing protein, partial [Janthinobacterium lividum]
RRTVRYGPLTLFSAFEPIFSVSHMRAAGYEALLRAHDDLNRSVSPLEVFGQAARLGDLLELDRLTQSLHLANFRNLQRDHEWLFLNIHPAAMADFRHGAALLAEMKTLGIAPQRVVLEVLEQPHGDPSRLVESVQMFRRHGFLIALDDFGAGHSNIDRVWQLQPDIVKLDRSMVFQATRHTHVERILPGLVSLLHESGRLVLIEGVETEQEALIAMEANADFIQGHYFGRPSVVSVDALSAYKAMDSLADTFRARTEAHERDSAEHLMAYKEATLLTAARIAAGESLSDAGRDFLALDDAARCFLLDHRGRQIGDNVLPSRPMRQRARRFMPLLNSDGARWDRRPYFRSAVLDPGRVHATRPYLSINEAHLCVTLSVAVELPDASGSLQPSDGSADESSNFVVLCADVDWSRHDRPSHAPLFERGERTGEDAAVD